MIEEDEPELVSNIPGVDFVVATADFEQVAINEFFRDFKGIGCHDLNKRLAEFATDSSGAQPAAIRLLQAITNYHFDPDHRSEPFKPMWQMEGKRSLVPTDMKQEQIEVISELARGVVNHGLRARLSDVAWFMQRRRIDAAELAITSYCDSVDAVRRGEAHFSHGDSNPCGVGARQYLERACSISYGTGWRLDGSVRLKQLIRDLVNSAIEDGRSDDFWRIAEVDLDSHVSPKAHLGSSAENFAVGLAGSPEDRIRLLQLAARAYRQARDEESTNRCLAALAECHVQKADMAGSPMLEAAFLQDAIKVLRNLPGTRDRRDELSRRLRDVQPHIREEMGHFSTEVDLTELVERSIATVHGHSWPAAFLSLVLCERPPTPEEISEQGREHVRQHPLQAIIPTQVHDSQGRVVFRTTGLSLTEEPAGDHFRFLMAFLRDHSRNVTVSAAINPIRSTIAQEHPISPEVIVEMLDGSPFIPSGHHFIFAKAIAHFLAGEDLESLSLLVPQLENSLRYILALNGHDTTTEDDHGIQTEASLTVLLDPSKPWRRYLEEIIPARYIHEVDLLFDFRGGPAVRNQIAHGKITTGGFWDHNMVYAAWLIIHLAVLPLVKRWQKVEAAFASVTGLHRATDTPDAI